MGNPSSEGGGGIYQMLLEPPACAETRWNVFPGQEMRFGCYWHGLVDGLNPHINLLWFPTVDLDFFLGDFRSVVADNRELLFSPKTLTKNI